MTRKYCWSTNSFSKFHRIAPGGGGGGLHKYDLDRDVPLRLEK